MNTQQWKKMNCWLIKVKVDESESEKLPRGESAAVIAWTRDTDACSARVVWAEEGKSSILGYFWNKIGKFLGFFSIASSHPILPVQHARLQSFLDITGCRHLKYKTFKYFQSYEIDFDKCSHFAGFHRDRCRWQGGCNHHRGPSGRCLWSDLAWGLQWLNIIQEVHMIRWVDE